MQTGRTVPREGAMISRIWHGYTSPENADAYEGLLKSEIFTGIEGRGIPGFRGIQLFRRGLATARTLMCPPRFT